MGYSPPGKSLRKTEDSLGLGFGPKNAGGPRQTSTDAKGSDFIRLWKQGKREGRAGGSRQRQWTSVRANVSVVGKKENIDRE